MNSLPSAHLALYMLGVASGIALMALLTWATDRVAARLADEHAENEAPAPVAMRRRNRDAFPSGTSEMIQAEVKLSAPGAVVTSCACGRLPRLIETRGNPNTERLATLRTVAYHFECAPCALTTPRADTQAAALALWNDGATHPITATRLSA